MIPCRAIRRFLSYGESLLTKNTYDNNERINVKLLASFS